MGSRNPSRMGLIGPMLKKIIVAVMVATAAPSAMCVLAQSKPAEWDKIVEAAKKEGKVVAAIPPSPELRKTMELAFTRRYGIATEFVPARGGAIIQRMVSEAKSGVQYFDVHIGGTESIVTGLLPENILEPVEPFFILPDVRDPKQWWGGHIYIDNAKRFIYNFVAYQTVSLWTNPNEYKPAEFKSFDDLLSAKLQGKIGISDPRTPGSGSSMWSYMHYIKGEEFLKRLVAQKLFVTRDLRLLAENLAKGKSPSPPESAIRNSIHLSKPICRWFLSRCPRKAFTSAAATAISQYSRISRTRTRPEFSSIGC
jgi:ABC-type Fe3+ transport system, periplasmic component